MKIMPPSLVAKKGNNQYICLIKNILLICLFIWYLAHIVCVCFNYKKYLSFLNYI